MNVRTIFHLDVHSSSHFRSEFNRVFHVSSHLSLFEGYRESLI